MPGLTAEDYELDKHQEDDMNAHNLRWRPTPPRVQAILTRLRQEPPVDRTPKLNGMDRAILAEQRKQV